MLAELIWGVGCYFAGIATVAGGAFAYVARARRRATRAAATTPFNFTTYRLDED